MSVLAFPTTHEIEPGFITGPDLAITSGASYRQIDYWSRCGYLTALPRSRDTSGIPRLFTTDQVPIATLLYRFSVAGLPPPQAMPLVLELLENGQGTLAGLHVHLPEEL